MTNTAFKVFTIFPEMFPGPFQHSLAGTALEKGIWSLDTVNLREFGIDKHASVDDTSYGGGAGMVMRPDVIGNAFEAHYGDQRPDSLIYMTPRGKPLCQERVKKLAKCASIGVLCGRFEGVDQRVIDTWNCEEISIGDYVLSGGEPAACIMIDAIVRLLPGVMGSAESLVEESYSDGLLEYPQYTRPQVWNGQSVPEILMSGHHQKIQEWRQNQAKKITEERRPDLWKKYNAD